MVNSIDFQKAFDSVHRTALWNILKYHGVPERYINIFKALYNKSSCSVKMNTGITELFENRFRGKTRLHLIPILIRGNESVAANSWTKRAVAIQHFISSI